MAKLTRLKLVSPSYGGKKFSMTEDGSLQKDTVGYLSEAKAKVVEFDDLTGLAAILAGLKAGQHVLAYGIPVIEAKTVLSEGSYNARKDKTGCVRRAEEHFRWDDGPGVLLWDYDPRGGHDVMTAPAIVSALIETAPELASVQILVGVSSSSHIWSTETGEELQGLHGQRFYLLAKDATDIPRAMECFVARLWLKGYGHLLVSSSGAQLVRAIIDPTVFQASRLDYASGAVCDPGLEQRRPELELWHKDGAHMVDICG